MIRFQRALGPMAEVVGRLTHLDLPCLDPQCVSACKIDPYSGVIGVQF